MSKWKSGDRAIYTGISGQDRIKVTLIEWSPRNNWWLAFAGNSEWSIFESSLMEVKDKRRMMQPIWMRMKK